MLYLKGLGNGGFATPKTHPTPGDGQPRARRRRLRRRRPARSGRGQLDRSGRRGAHGQRPRRFRDARILAGPNRPWSVATGDFDHNGRDEVAIGNASSDRIIVYYSLIPR
jgi:hypothetical protein